MKRPHDDDMRDSLSKRIAPTDDEPHSLSPPQTEGEYEQSNEPEEAPKRCEEGIETENEDADGAGNQTEDEQEIEKANETEDKEGNKTKDEKGEKQGADIASSSKQHLSTSTQQQPFKP